MATLRPGTSVQVLTSPPPRSSPTNTGVWFVTGITEQGKTTGPILIQSMNDYTRLLGARVNYGTLYDPLDVFFREGGAAAYVGRVVGPAAVIGSRNLVDGVAAISLIVKALGPGAYSANIKVAVVAGVGGGTYQLQVTDVNNVVLEQSGDLTTQQDAVNWASYSNYIRVTVGASALIPVVGGANVLGVLAGGADDRASIVDASWLLALNLFTKDLGPGNVSAPGRTTDVGHTQLADHAFANNRVAILDGPDTFVEATHDTSAINAKSTGHQRDEGYFAPWITGPGILAGTFRTVPPSAFVAGRCAAVDPILGPGTPAAGLAQGVSTWATDISQPGWDDTTRDRMNTAGINVIRNIGGNVVIFGWRTLADPINDAAWLPLGTVRYLKGLVARALNVGQQFVFAPIDGQGHTIAAFHGALVALCQTDWEAGEIYGLTPDQAFNVDTGPSVNTPVVLAGNELRAAISVRPSPDAELVTIYIVNVPITQDVA